MKRTLMILVMLLLCVTGNSQRIAVLDFNAGVGVSQADVDGISAIFNTYFSPRGYTLVERTRIDRAIDEQNFQRSCITELSNKIAINPVAPSAPIGGGKSSSTSRKRTSVETIYGYLKVFPEEIGNFDSEPRTVINQLNNQSVHGYNTWRIPTNEELSLLRANGYLSGAQYMTKESPRGLVLLVTDKADAATLKAEYARTHGNINGHEYVDLGLSVKWATCNVGASKPEDYGNYYAWGETSTKSTYSESNSKTYGKQMYDIKGNSQYDAARVNWEGSWRLPTKTECQELVDRCTWKWTTQNGVNGYKVTGPNGNSIFLPAAGSRRGSSLDYAGEFGNYWSSTPRENYGYYAYRLYFDSSEPYVGINSRGSGRSVRPVSE